MGEDISEVSSEQKAVSRKAKRSEMERASVLSPAAAGDKI
jgi:hypothetical protein